MGAAKQSAIEVLRGKPGGTANAKLRDEDGSSEVKSSASLTSASGRAIDQRHIAALTKWLGRDDCVGSQQRLADEVSEHPLRFLEQHMNSLPAHLSSPILLAISPIARATIRVVSVRRRAYVHSPAMDDDLLGIASSSRRLPARWSRTFGQRSYQDVEEASRDVNATEKPADPPFPDHPAATVPGYLDTPEARGPDGKAKYGSPHRGDLFSHPRLVRLMEQQDRLENRPSEQTAEEVESDDGSACEDLQGLEDSVELRESLDSFQRAVFELFIAGDPTLPRSLYDAVDTDDRLDAGGLGGASGNTSALSRAGRSVLDDAERADEERWFDEDE
ncbi:unnamed protein product [Parajaminaea phylloscopi]